VRSRVSREAHANTHGLALIDEWSTAMTGSCD